MPRLHAVSLAFLALVALAADWPQFLGPQRDGHSAETGLFKDKPIAPRTLWEKAAGRGVAGPVVAEGRLILFHRMGNEEVTECLDAATGQGRWRFASATGFQDEFGIGDDGPRSTPVISGKRVFTLGAEGRLHCLDLATGRKVWDLDLQRQYQARKTFFGVGTSPLVEGDLLLVNVGGPTAGIVAFRAETGEELWKATDHEASYSSPIAIDLGKKRRVVFFTREGIVLLDPKTGSVDWSRRFRARIQASVNAATPLWADGHLFVSASYATGALALRLGDGAPAQVWANDESLSNHFNTSVHVKGHLYGIDGRQEGGARLRCVELTTGKVRWTRDDFGCASLIAVDGQVLALTEGGDLVRFVATPEAYVERTRDKILGPSCRAHIALSDGKLYARDAKRLGCWELRP